MICIPQNIFFCVQQNREIHTGLKQLEDMKAYPPSNKKKVLSYNYDFFLVIMTFSLTIATILKKKLELREKKSELQDINLQFSLSLKFRLFFLSQF